MANKGFVKDRSPQICPAGKLTTTEYTVADCLKNYTIQEVVDTLKHEAKIPDKERFIYKLPPLENHRNCGIYTKVYKTLRGPVKTRFQQLISDLKETPYQSYWDHSDGFRRDSTGMLPLNIDPYGTTFGTPSNRDETVKSLVNPDKKYEQISAEARVGHEYYKKSHNDYDVNEHKDRNYLPPSFNPKRVMGKKANYDPRGMGLKCCSKWRNKNEFSVANTVQAKFQQQHAFKLGECLTPNKNIECTPEGHTFGRPTRGTHGVAELLTENPTPKLKKDIIDLVALINPLRICLKRRENKLLFSFAKFLAAIKYYDTNGTGWIPLSTLYELCTCYDINFDEKLMNQLLVILKILKDDYVNYVQFVDILNWKSDFFETGDNYKTGGRQYYETTYRALLRDAICKDPDYTDFVPAGLPVRRFDKPQPTIPPGGCRAHLECLGQETESPTIIYPSIYTQYGLNFYDFFRLRSRQEMRSIYEALDYEFTDDSFDALWAEGCKIDKQGDFVCVNTFKDLLEQHPEIKIKSKEKSEENPKSCNCTDQCKT